MVKATAQIHSLAWEHPYAVGVAIKKIFFFRTSLVSHWSVSFLRLKIILFMMNDSCSCCGSIGKKPSIHEDLGPTPALIQWVKDLMLPQAVV